MRKWIKSLVTSVPAIESEVSSFDRSDEGGVAVLEAPAAAVSPTLESLEGRRLFSSALARGINANSVNSGNYAAVVNMLHDTHTPTVRLFISVNSYSSRSENGVFKLVRWFHQDGFDTMVTVDPASGLRGSYGQVEGYFDFLADSLGGSVDRWQVGNEPDRKYPWAGHLDDYVTDLLKPAADALHDHGEKVVSAGVSWNPDDVATMVHAGMLNYVDFVGYHPYLKSVGALKDAVAEVKALAGGKPLIASEWNARGHEGGPRSEWADAITDYWPTIRDNFYAAYYFAAIKINSMAGPAGVLTSGGGHNEPFYSTYKALGSNFSGGGTVQQPPAQQPPVQQPPVQQPPSQQPGQQPSGGNQAASTGRPSVGGFKIIDGVTGQTIKGYENVTASTTIKLSSLAHRQIQIAALVTSNTSSVRFGFSTKAARFENVAPYTAFVDGHGSESPWYSTYGAYTLSATGYTADNGAGTMGNTLSIVLKFV